MQTETYTTMDYNELEGLAKKYFSIDYEYPAEEEVANDSANEYSVNQHSAENFDWQGWARFLENGQNKGRKYGAYLLLERLVMLGVIPEGSILIKVSW
jgi:hypothetical protein